MFNLNKRTEHSTQWRKYENTLSSQLKTKQLKTMIYANIFSHEAKFHSAKQNRGDKMNIKNVIIKSINLNAKKALLYSHGGYTPRR